jgi:hypothetical protein
MTSISYAAPRLMMMMIFHASPSPLAVLSPLMLFVFLGGISALYSVLYGGLCLGCNIISLERFLAAVCVVHGNVLEGSHPRGQSCLQMQGINSRAMSLILVRFDLSHIYLVSQKSLLGSEYSPAGLTAMFYPRGGGKTTFKFPAGRSGLRCERGPRQPNIVE